MTCIETSPDSKPAIFIKENKLLFAAGLLLVPALPSVLAKKSSNGFVCRNQRHGKRAQQKRKSRGVTQIKIEWRLGGLAARERGVGSPQNKEGERRQ